MIQCLRVREHNRTYHLISDTEAEDWEEILDLIEGEPQLIERVEGWQPYTHAYRLPDGTVYLVACGIQE